MGKLDRSQRAALVALAILAGLMAALALLSLRAKGQPTPSADAEDGVQVARLSVPPTPEPEPMLTFVADASQPMPENAYRHALGTDRPIAGEVRANYPLTGVTVSISCAYNSNELYPYRQTVTFAEGSGVYAYRFDSAETAEGVSLSSLLDLSVLQTGVHTLKVIASCEAARSIELLRVRFYVFGDAWEQIVPEDFNDSYRAALRFFGGEPERFCYRYQWVDRRYILADPDWEEKYITEIEGLPQGQTWRVHTDAVPYYEKALGYLRDTHVRVSGTNGDSGVIRLQELIATYDGSYVSRFTSSLKTVSHHGFGTASDLNAALAPNQNNEANHRVIRDEVEKHLVYNGIRTENGLSYYDFTYDGAYEAAVSGVPETLLNYLLYELAFYRSGFLWGFYYRSTSDAMHFTLSEHVYGSHEDRSSIRKVFAYIEEEAH